MMERPVPSAPLEIRLLSPDDVSLMQSMSTVFGEAFDEVETYCGARPGAAYLAQLLSSEHFIALAALERGEVVGGIAAYELQKFEQERREIFVYDLAVASAHRRRGIATALIREMKAIAARRGAHVVFVQAEAGDGPAIALYSGFSRGEEALHFEIEVGDG